MSAAVARPAQNRHGTDPAATIPVPQVDATLHLSPGPCRGWPSVRWPG
jgi:hypothetical protein